MAEPEQAPLARAADRGALVLGLLAGIFLLAQLLDFAHGRDQAIFAVVAERMLAGGAPYADAWDFKTPGIYGAYALAQGLFGNTVVAIRILEVLAILSTVGAFAVLSRRAMGNAAWGLVGGLVATLGWVELEFWHTAQPESFAVPVLAWALVAATQPPRTKRVVWSWVAAGALFSVAALLKPPLGGGFVTCLLAAILQRPRSWKPVLGYTAGAVLVWAATLGWLAAKGALHEAYETLLVWTPNYTRIPTEESASLLSGLGSATYLWLVGFSPFHGPGLGLWFVLPGKSGREWQTANLLAGILFFGLLGIALQGKFFDYHFGAVIPLTALLAGWGYARAWTRLRAHPAGLLLALAGLAAILGGLVPTREKGPAELWHRCAVRFDLWRDPGGTQELRDKLYSYPGSPAGPRRRAAEWVAEHTPTDANLFVWGFEPGIYFESQRRPASRFIYNVPQRVEWRSEADCADLIADLERRTPAALVVQTGDALPWVTGNEKDSAAALGDVPELAAWIAARYVHAETIGPFEIYTSIAGE